MSEWLSARASYVALAISTIAVGLAVHRLGAPLGLATRDVLGDALWAMMMAWLVAALVPNAALRLRLAVALGLCFLVESSQLYHAPALDAVRSTLLGHLVLGSGYDPRDFVAYTVGVLVAGTLDHLGLRRARRQRQRAPESGPR